MALNNEGSMVEIIQEKYVPIQFLERLLGKDLGNLYNQLILTLECRREICFQARHSLRIDDTLQAIKSLGVIYPSHLADEVSLFGVYQHITFAGRCSNWGLNFYNDVLGVIEWF